MEKENIIDLQERIEKAVENFETIEKEALSFANAKGDLKNIALNLQELITESKIQIQKLSELVAIVRSTTVEETLNQFNENSKKISESLLEYNKNYLESLTYHENSNKKKLILFGSLSIFIMVVNLIISILV